MSHSETPWTVDCEAPLAMEFCSQECWSGLPCPSPGDLPNPMIEPRSPALQADSLPSEPPGKQLTLLVCLNTSTFFKTSYTTSYTVKGQGHYWQECPVRNPSPLQPLPSTSCFPHGISLPVPGCCRSHREPRTFQEEKSIILFVPVFEVGGSLYTARHLTHSSSLLSLRRIKEPQFPAPFDCNCGFSRIPMALLDSESRTGVMVFSASIGTLIMTLLGLAYSKQDWEVRKACKLPLDFHVLCCSFSIPSRRFSRTNSIQDVMTKV